MKRQKLIWPNAKVGNEELTSYFECVASVAHKYFQRRPVHLICAPHGCTERAKLVHARTRTLECKESFRALAALRAVEIHTAHLREDKPHFPDHIVLELQAEAGLPGDILKVAGITQKLLNDLNLNFIWQLTGAQPTAALNVLIPIRRRYASAAVFDFSKMLAELIYENAVELTRLKLPARTVKYAEPVAVVIDYHANHSHHVSLAPFSPRALARPTIALPVASETLFSNQIISSQLLPQFEIDISESRLRDSAQLMSETFNRANDLEPVFISIEERFQKVS